jgi:hypothetical protein
MVAAIIARLICRGNIGGGGRIRRVHTISKVCKMENIMTLSNELGSAIDRINSGIGVCKLDSLIVQLKAVESIFISRAGDNSTLIRETKTRIAEAVFLASIAKMSSFQLCKRLFAELYKLGFSNRHRELTFCIIFARRCLQCKQFSEGIHFLKPFEDEWNQENQGIMSRYSNEDVKITRDLLQELRTRFVPR